MRHGSLFSGIGGFDLAAEWMGWTNVFHCEWMEFPRKVLDYHFPNSDSHIDICTTDFKKYANKIDILTGGFPCQPFSQAGKRKGTDDERYLWGEMLRAIQEIKPTFVIAENVFGITNIDGGLVFESVCLDLETEGYEVQPFIIPACAKNAPHRRDRVWFVAYSKSARTRKDIGGIWSKYNGCSEGIQKSGVTTNTNNTRTNHDIGIDGNGKEENQKRGRQSQFEHRSDGDNGIATNTKSNGSSISKLGESESKEQVQTRSDIDGFESLGDATNSNCDGFGKQWRYDGCREINARSNASGKWSTNSKNSHNGDTSTNLIGQSTIDGRIGEQANVETNQFTTAKGICGVDKECDQCKGIISNDRCKNVNCRALVQNGHERVQPSEHRGMDKDCGDISSDGTNECENDGTIINRMDGNVADSTSIGLHRQKHKQKLGSTRWSKFQFGKSKIKSNATNSNGNGFNERNGNDEINTSTRGGENNGQGESRFNDQKSSPNNWNNFPTQPPICGGNDGIPTELDGITFPKWRAESIKGYGNAIVPQIAYQLFQIINEL